MSQSREELIYLAKVNEQCERFEDMLSNMKQVVKLDQELSIEERNLLSVAYKNSVGSRRTAWRAISSIEQKEESKGSKNINLLREYKKKIEQELSQFCNDILELLDSHLVPKSKEIIIDILLEYASGQTHDQAANGALDAYQKASDIANKDLNTTHPIRLGLALNFSVFYYEVMNDPSKACNLAKQAFDEAIADIEHIEEDQYKDATTIMQLIRDNLTLWTSELQNDEEDAQVENI
ncbi:hypothetical protein IMG5_058070 [Ichthyophthirius multifiliis]|uniref:14-3-3 domain-containing protein n=1 Tax=Ichthyophthirius multifiliis TaxID=5932 RepID=G0QNG2_ICHMU|nr:hypothetical protein IMG5_058070 [Ichthyophthirius multifiliis]EGR33251.1 hypothetical protein IMG5_058070 [Ichthyophthirius multifiliis]|eukprot:XP_004037237.1 hypothetical protein IMG5_058070 [Ichthyophthirius multifiliis]